jgi:hypothetical protein
MLPEPFPNRIGQVYSGWKRRHIENMTTVILSATFAALKRNC